LNFNGYQGALYEKTSSLVLAIIFDGAALANPMPTSVMW
jgi:hypothetical protein